MGTIRYRAAEVNRLKNSYREAGRTPRKTGVLRFTDESEPERNGHALAFRLRRRARFCRFKRARWRACLARFPHRVMLHQRRAWPRVLSRKKRVQGDFAHDFTRARSSDVMKLAIACAIGKSSESGVRQRRRVRHSSPDVADRSVASTGPATIAPYASSRSSILFSGSSSGRESLSNECPLCARMKPRNHSLRARA